MMVEDFDFNAAFSALTNYRPLGWQQRLFERFCLATDVPQICDLPTGLGKTSVIPIFVIALAYQAKRGTITLPRRLVYVVNRRTVVDQATTVVENIRERLLKPEDDRWQEHRETLVAVDSSLRSLSTNIDEPSLAISTLRGELADNEEWKTDPAKPAVIIGTIDMIGSKLLFNGYGDGRYLRSQHAGLIGHDSLVIHDESHLTPAFSELLQQLARVQRQSGEPRPVMVMELSATSRDGSVPAFRLESADEADKVVADRLGAGKRLQVHEVETKADEKQKDAHKKVLDKIVELSSRYKNGHDKVLVYVRSPEDAVEILQKLQAEVDDNDRIEILTGTIRGYERDKLVQTVVYQAFLNPSVEVDRTVYLISTSAGEVGIDIDAQHMICDLTTLDSLIQRLGRVNRRGGFAKVACIDIVVHLEAADGNRELSGIQQAMNVTLSILREWESSSSGEGIDVSPRGLGALIESLDADRKKKAFSPVPATPHLTDILLDAWTLTSINGNMPGRPEVAAYLHGIEKELPETYVVWRKEVLLLAKARIDEYALSEWFQASRIHVHEQLRDRTDRVQKTLDSLLTKHRDQRKDQTLDFPVVLLNERGEADLRYLSEIAGKELNLRYRTVVLPIEAGGLTDKGTLDAKTTIEAKDVAEEKQGPGQRRQRRLMIGNGDSQVYQPLLGENKSDDSPDRLREAYRITLADSSEYTSEGNRELVLMTEPNQLSFEQAETARIHQTLDFHLDSIARKMEHICVALQLEKGLRDALIIAAKWHDRGKNRPIWQWYANNDNPETPLAKSTRYRNGRALGHYRHEFGSLLEAAADDEIRDHAEADLILHLIAAHHGWARPYFEPSARDNTCTTAENEAEATEAMRRFGRLQQRFGRWGLAWLESLLRCADIAASKLEEKE